MDKKAELLKIKIEKLTSQLNKIEEKKVQSISKTINNMTKKGLDIRVLAGIILNAEDVIKSLPNKVEAWQVAGEKFLFKSKRTSPDKPGKTASKKKRAGN